MFEEMLHPTNKYLVSVQIVYFAKRCEWCYDYGKGLPSYSERDTGIISSFFIISTLCFL